MRSFSLNYLNNKIIYNIASRSARHVLWWCHAPRPGGRGVKPLRDQEAWVTTQQLGRRDTYTPRDDAPVPGSVAARLNSSERVGAVLCGLKTRPNNSEEHLTGSGQLRGRVVITCRKSCPHYKTKEVIRAIRAEARGLLAHG